MLYFLAYIISIYKNRKKVLFASVVTCSVLRPFDALLFCNENNMFDHPVRDGCAMLSLCWHTYNMEAFSFNSSYKTIKMWELF